MTEEVPLSAAASSRGFSLLTVAVTIVSGAYGASFWLDRPEGPTDAAYADAGRAIRARYAPGDRVILAPAYATRLLEAVGDLDVVAPRAPLAEDLRAYRHVIVAGLTDAVDTLGPALEASGLERLERGVYGPALVVARYRVRRPWSVAFDARAALPKARVWYETPDGRVERCGEWSATNGQGGALGRWLCPRDRDWFYVAPEYHRMGDQLRLCLWAHPPSGGRLVVAFGDVPMTGHLYGHAGHTLNGSVYARERVDLDVAIGDGAPQRFAFALDEHWRPFALATPTTGTATVSFAVSSPDPGANHFCFVADTRAPALGPTATSTVGGAP
jgi:hypothetical protein